MDENLKVKATHYKSPLIAIAIVIGFFAVIFFCVINKPNGGFLLDSYNIFILSTAGLVFGWDRAMYSLLHIYFIAFKVIDITIEGLMKRRQPL